MKYTIESTETGCIETLEFRNGSKFTKRSEKTAYGCQALEPEFSYQLESSGFDEEIIERVDELFDGCLSLDFMKLARLEG